VTRGWRKLQNEQLHRFYSSHNSLKRRRNVRKYQQRRPCGKNSQLWEDNTLPFLLPYMKKFNTKYS
jgi:hypothetical protein